MIDPVPTDPQLIVQILAGDPEGASRLIDRYQAALRRVLLQAGARSEEIDDVLQETWIRMIRSASRYDPLQPFAGWLFTIAMNRFRTRAASRQEEWKRHEPLDRIESTADSTADSAHSAMESAERASQVRTLVHALPPHLADAVLLRYFEELSEKEIAASLGIPVGTVKSRLHAAIIRLRLSLERSPA